MRLSGKLIAGFALAAGVSLTPAAAEEVAINEVMASNASTCADEDGDTEDWIELFNSGEAPVSLENWGLSDDYGNPFRWVFPEVTIQPGQFLLVWASGKDRRDPGGELHTNFRIASAGEEVLLTNPLGERIDEIPPTKIPTDISYGRRPDGNGEWFFFDQPTPGSANTTPGYTEILEPPAFSRPGGFYGDAFELILSHPDPEATIVYTLDGSIPDPDNLSGTPYLYKNSYPQSPGQPFGAFLTKSFQSRTYGSAIPIHDRSPDPDKLTRISTTWHFSPAYFPETPVRKGTVIRARAFREGALSSPVITYSYFVHSCENPSNLPVISISLQENALFDYGDGIYVAGKDFDSWRRNNPGARPTGGSPANYHRRGDEWEHPGHLEFFPPGSAAPALRQDMGIRIHGGWRRSSYFKSLRLYARNLYSRPDFSHRIFPEMPYDSFKRLILRNSGQDYGTTLFRDAAIQAMVSHLNFDTQAYRPAIVFINGEYWGIHNIRERYDRHYLARVYGVEEENIDLLTGNQHVKEGDASHYAALREYMAENDLADDPHYEYITTRMDIENFTDYQIAQIFARNTDWPAGNIDFWRSRTDDYEPDAPHGRDGRWRWLMFDTDHGFGLFGGTDSYTHNTLAYAASPQQWPGAGNFPWSTLIFRSLLENEDFKNNFINRFADQLNTAFLPERTAGIINRLKMNIAPEIPGHVHRWGRPSSLAAWQESVGVMIEFANERPDYQRQHIREHFGIESDVEVTVDVSNRWHGHIRVNTIEIRDGTPGIEGNPYPWTGIYFSGIPVELEAIPAPGYEFSHWEGGVESTEPVIGVTPAGDLELKAHFTRSFETVPVYFWLFDTSLPNDTPLEEVAPTYSLGEGAVLSFHSALDGYPFSEGHENWRKASMERRNAPTALNYRPGANFGIPFEETSMRGLQVRQPFVGDGGENTMVFDLPTEGFKEVVFSFAAKDEGAADSLRLDYSIAEVEDWITAGLSVTEPVLEPEYHLYSLDFSSIPETAGNPDFRVRIRFGGTDMTADEGDRVTFNNIALDAKPLEGVNLPPEVAGAFGPQKMIEGGEELRLDLNDVFNDPDNDPLVFGAAADGDAVSLEVEGGVLTLTPRKRGGAVVTVTADDGNHPPVETGFRVLVHPEAYTLSGEGNFAFTSWDADEPEGCYPENMLFLQSDGDDPGPADPLLHPYFIPHDDYHEDDTVGFPYNNERRTRINGLGEDGISFINTGRGRDLGGALAALDTRGLWGAGISWLAETLLRNEREYALRLQYRVGIDGPFLNLTKDGGLVEYRAGEDGDTRDFTHIPLPPDALEEEYVQLLWRYHHVSGESGPRAQLRLDEIRVKPSAAVPVFSPDGGSFPAPDVSVTVGCATPGAIVRYTTDGSEPEETSPAVPSGEAVKVPVPGTLKARAWKTGMFPSEIRTAYYTELTQPPAPPDEPLFSRWFLPAGAVAIEGTPIDTYILAANPNDGIVRLEAVFVDEDGEIASVKPVFELGPRSRRTFRIGDYLGADETSPSSISTIVRSLDGRAVFCERAIYGPAGAGPSGWLFGNNTVGAAEVSSEWNLPEGATHIFDQFVHVLNPGPDWAYLDIEFMDGGGDAKTKDYRLEPMSNITIPVHKIAGWEDRNQISTRITSYGNPVAVDRTMYWPVGGPEAWRGSHSSRGISAPSTLWYLAEGANHIFDHYILVSNPGNAAAEVTFTFLDRDGNSETHTRTVFPRTRHTVHVNTIPGWEKKEEVSTIIESSHGIPVFAERAMYWPKGPADGWIGGHNTAGLAAPSTSWRFPEGATHIFDQYVLAANPDKDREADLLFTFNDDQGGEWTHRAVVHPRRRYTVKVNDVVGTLEQVATTVESTNNVPVFAERAMYLLDEPEWKDGHVSIGVGE